MRPGTRSSAQSYRPPPDDESSSEYASSPPEAAGIEFDGREAVRLQRFETNQYTPTTGYSPTSPLRLQTASMDTPRRIPHQTGRQTPLEEESANVEETSSLLQRSPNKPNIRDGRVRIRPRGCSLVSFILACMSVAFLGLVAHSFLNLQRDPKGCKMSFMYPSYAKLSDFDTEHTRFATKYSLYLYREQKMDTSMEPNGVPVLFIPGNAGSYRQVRPIAAEAASQFFHAYRQNNSILQDGIRNLDFFTVDFNEDFSAFHGQTLLDQAEYLNEAVSYILSLYHETRRAPHDIGLPDPQSVIIVGHSMGGVVARAMLTMPNYLPNSINTIITMAAPHALPPAPFDWEMQRIYNSVNGYWRKAYAAKWANNNPLWHVTLISIAGGGLDNTVASDYTATSSIVPMTNGFTVYTSTVPGVWTGMDHQAILWCDQFRKVVAKSLLEVVDVRRSAQTITRAERMQVFRKLYLTGLEENIQKPLPYGSPVTVLTVGDASHRNLRLGERLRVPVLGSGITVKPRIHLLPVPPEKSHPWLSSFSLLTDQNLTQPRQSGIEVLFCTVLPLEGKQIPEWQFQYPDTLNNVAATYAHGSQVKIDTTTRLACKDASADAIILPASTAHSAYPFQGETFSYLQYDLPSVGEHQFVAVVEHPKETPGGFVVAEFYHTDAAKIQSNISISGLLTHGLHERFPVSRAVTTELNIPALESSLLAYKIQVTTNNCDDQLFRPFVRQSIAEPYESKFFVNVHDADLNLHGLAPYLVPQVRKGGNVPSQGVTLQFWTDPSCDSPLDIQIKFDLMGSFGKTVMRYRIAMAAFPLAIVALCLKRQFSEYNTGGYFVSFDDSLLLVIRDSLPTLLLLISVASVWLASIQTPEVSPFFVLNGRALEALDRFRGTNVDSPRRNDMLLGLREPFLWFLAPIFVLVCVGITIVVSKIAFFATVAITALWNKIPSFPWLGAMQWLDRSAPWLAGLFRWIGSWWATESRPIPAAGNVAASSRTKRRIVVTLVLLFIVATVVPFQFAYVVACVVQFSSCVKALNRTRDLRNDRRHDKSVKAWSFFNYTHSLFVLMIWLLPVNIPVLVVWVRNLQVAWLTPFSSHHNVLSIAPFILLVETVTSSQMIPRQNCYCKSITSILFLLLCSYALFYGVMYAYLLHYLTNLVAAWLVLIHFSDVWHQRGHPLKALFDLFGNGETKKRP